MDKKLFMLLLIFLSASLILSGCMQQQPSNTTDVINMFRCDTLKSYTYHVSNLGGGGQIVGYSIDTISSDTINGTAAWLHKIEFQVEYTVDSRGKVYGGINQIYKMWIDKATGECLKTTEIVEKGIIPFFSYECMKQETCAPLEIEGEKTPLKYLGTESITVPAGAFLCDTYDDGTFTYWISKDVPIPVKISHVAPRAAIRYFELVNYST